MRVVLEIKSGPYAGRKSWLGEGETLQVGRNATTGLTLPEDGALSSLHFALELSRGACRLRDQTSRNGTYVNGVKVTEIELKEGDEILAGRTKFVVRFDHEAKAPSRSAADAPTTRLDQPAVPAASAAQVTAGHWQFSVVPTGWQVVAGLGLMQVAQGRFPSSVVITEDELPADMTLRAYVDKQRSLFPERLPELKVEGVKPTKLKGVEETAALTLSHTQPGQPITQHQIYTRQGRQVSVITLTTRPEDLSQVRPVFKKILAGLSLVSDW